MVVVVVWVVMVVVLALGDGGGVCTEGVCSRYSDSCQITCWHCNSNHSPCIPVVAVPVCHVAGQIVFYCRDDCSLLLQAV